MNRIGNRDIRGRCGNRSSVLERVDQSVLKWFGHMEGVEREKLIITAYRTWVDKGKRNVRPKRGRTG